MDKGLYKPGDIFRVNENGWLTKIGEDRDDIA
jgi:non-ribosomal peptide synthetase component E (peptide arylation enzyme)